MSNSKLIITPLNLQTIYFTYSFLDLKDQQLHDFIIDILSKLNFQSILYLQYK